MFRNQFIYPEMDIINLQSYEDCEKCGIELDSVGRPVGSQPVDQFDSQPFMMGENGFRRSDISILMSSQSDDLKSAIAARMTEIKSNFPDQSLSDSELAKMAYPRYAQGYADTRDWMASLDKSGLSKAIDSYVEANKPKESEKEVIDFSDSKTE